MLAAFQLRGGESIAFPRISASASRELGYVHWIERARLQVGDEDEVRTVVLRDTTIFRCEDGEFQPPTWPQRSWSERMSRSPLRRGTM